MMTVTVAFRGPDERVYYNVAEAVNLPEGLTLADEKRRLIAFFPMHALTCVEVEHDVQP